MRSRLGPSWDKFDEEMEVRIHRSANDRPVPDNVGNVGPDTAIMNA